MQVGDLVKKRNCVGVGIVVKITDEFALVCAETKWSPLGHCKVWVGLRRLEVVK